MNKRASGVRMHVSSLPGAYGIGKDTKMNVPGVPNGNWAFRVTQEQLDGIDKGRRVSVGFCLANFRCADIMGKRKVPFGRKIV